MQSLLEGIPGGAGFPLALQESIPRSVRVGMSVHEEDAADPAAAEQASCCDDQTLVSFYEVICLLSVSWPFKDASWWVDTTVMCLRKLKLGEPQLVLSVPCDFPGQMRLWSDEP